MREKCDMQLQDFYEMLGGSYQEIKERLQSDELILRLTFKFLNDKSYENLCRAVEEEDYEECCVIVGGREWHSNCMSPAELAEFAELANACHFFN